MTEELTVSNQLPAMRLIDSPIGKVIPVLDIADNIGYDRSSITKTIQRNLALFEGLTLSQTLSTPGGMQTFLCVNRMGLDRIIMLIRPIKNRKELFERAEAFKAKAFEKLADLKETPQSTNQISVDPISRQLALSSLSFIKL